MSVLEYVHARQFGGGACNAVTPASVIDSLYKSFKKRSAIKVTNTINSAVNNLEFSSDGRMLVAVTADRCVMLLDPITRKQVNCVYQAHDSSINDICFMEDRTFVTCGDDNVVHVWDTRHLGSRVVSLTSHGSWVKSVQRVHGESGLLLSCSLDGSLILWDVNGGRGSSMRGTYNRRVLLMPGIVRASLSPRADRLALTTTAGFVLLIHHLNLNTLHRLLDGFLPIVYRSMYHTKTPMPTLMKFNHLFSADRKENRLEFIDESPLTKFTIVTGAQFHPQGQYLMTRNWNRNSFAEHTCVYDVTGNGYWKSKKAPHFHWIKRSNEDHSQIQDQDGTVNADGEPMVLLDVLQSLTRLEEVRIHSAYHRRYSVHSSGIPPPVALLNPQSLEPSASPNRTLLEEPLLKLDDPDLNFCGPTPPVYYNHKRLIGWRLEDRVRASSHTIKENSWSPDGRVIASPSANKVNLYAFERGDVPLPYTRDDMPVAGDVHVELAAVARLTQPGQPNVVCTRFQPRHDMRLVAGDHSGKVIFYEPTFF